MADDELEVQGSVPGRDRPRPGNLWVHLASCPVNTGRLSPGVNAADESGYHLRKRRG